MNKKLNIKNRILINKLIDLEEIEHKEQVIDKYFENLSSVFAIISRCESGEKIDKYLDGPVCHQGFKRLN